MIRIADPANSTFLNPDLQAQADMMTVLRSHTQVPVPQVLAVDSSGDILGVPAMIMERLDGRVPSDFPGYNHSGFVHEMPVPDRRQLWTSAMDTMLAIHRTPLATVAHVQNIPQSLGELVGYWADSLEWVESRRRAPAPSMRHTLDWLQAEQPAQDAGLSWGDARIGNVIFHQGRTAGVLDWEMCSLGGPEADLAWWLMFDVNHSTDLGLSRLDGLGNREETIAYWENGMGRPVSSLAWHEVFSLFRLATIRMSMYEQRASRGQPTPGPSDPRSVERLEQRIYTRISNAA